MNIPHNLQMLISVSEISFLQVKFISINTLTILYPLMPLIQPISALNYSLILFAIILTPTIHDISQIQQASYHGDGELPKLMKVSKFFVKPNNLYSFQITSMFGTSDPNSKEATSRAARPMKKSTYLSELELQRKQRIEGIRTSKKQLTYSTFLDLTPEHTRANFSKFDARKETTDRLPETEDGIKRARSLKPMTFDKPAIDATEKNTAEELNENVIKLKVEEMTFKFRTKIGSLLKELSVSAPELHRFGNLGRIDDILHFLSDKVRENLVKTQIEEANVHKARSKQKYTMGEYEVELDSLRKKLKDKEVTEKLLKNRVKEAHNESKILLDKINLKEKQLSSKVTEMYQLKTTSKQSEKAFTNLQQRYEILENEVSGYQSQLESDSKSIVTYNKQLQDENIQLKDKVQELEEELSTSNDKQTTLSEMNTNLNQELSRWRQRFEDKQFNQSQTVKSRQTNQMTETISEDRKIHRTSTISINGNFFKGDRRNSTHRFSSSAFEIQNMRLSLKVEELEKKNQQLTREILNYATIKQQYELNLSGTSQPSFDSKTIIQLKQQPIDTNKIDLEAQYSNKIQAMANLWKTKLYQIVHKYEDELEQSKQTINSLTIDKQQLEKKVIDLANEKYQIENKVIELEKQIYSVMKMYKNLNNQKQDPIRQSNTSQDLSEQRKSIELQDPTRPVRTESNLTAKEHQDNSEQSS